MAREGYDLTRLEPDDIDRLVYALESLHADNPDFTLWYIDCDYQGNDGLHYSEKCPITAEYLLRDIHSKVRVKEVGA